MYILLSHFIYASRITRLRSDHCSIIISISAFYFWKINFNLFSLEILAFPKTFLLLKPASKCSPWCLMGPICSTCVRSQIHHYICAKFIPNRSSRLTTFPRLLNCWPPKPPQMPPWGIVGWIVLAYVHSQKNPQTCTEFGANRSIRLAAFPDLHLWPPKTPEMPPVVLMGELYMGGSQKTCTNVWHRACWTRPAYLGG